VKKILCVIGIVLSIITALVLLIFAEIRVSNKKYNEALVNIPTKHYIEEDLETVFVSTAVSVRDFEIEDECLIYTVEVEGHYYLVLYMLTRKTEGMFKNLGNIVDTALDMFR
jgi:hypothetical protein